jgi:hypothetical protein
VLSVAQLLTPLTAAQFRSTAVTILQNLGLQPQNWAQGGIASSILTAGCNILASLSSQLANAIAQQWNPTATGGGLQLLAQYFYGVTPPQPTFAIGELTLSNEGGGVYSYAPYTYSIASTVANAAGVYPVYTNSEAFTLGAGTEVNPTVVTFDIVCTNVQGSGGNAAPGFVTNQVTALDGVSASNADAVVGSDALSDPALRALNLSALAVQSVFGPRGAYAYAIATAVNSVTGQPVNVNRQSISIASHTGDVTITVASPAGPVTLTDLQGISNNIEKLARPDGVTVLPGAPGFPSQPASATTVPYEPSITVYVLAPPGTTAAALQNVITQALATWFSGPTNPIGGTTASDDTNASFTGIFESGITGVIAQAVATQANCFMLSTRFQGVSDLPLAPGQVAVFGASVNVQVQYSS